MVDYTSVEAFSHTLPDVSEDLRDVLFLTPYAPDAFAPGCALAASRGYLGCLPFAAVGKDQADADSSARLLRTVRVFARPHRPTRSVILDFERGGVESRDRRQNCVGHTGHQGATGCGYRLAHVRVDSSGRRHR